MPLAAAFHRAGFPVLGFDVDPAKIELLRRGENYLKHLGPEMVADMRKAGRFDATADFSRLGEADAVISCAPTPLGKHLEPDLSYDEQSARDIAKTLRPQQLVVLESTTYPRTTREVMLPLFEARLASGTQERRCFESSVRPGDSATACRGARCFGSGA